MNLWKSLEGLVEVRLTSADIAGMLEELRKSGVVVDRVRFEDELTAIITLGRKVYPKLHILTEKRGGTLTLLHHKGIYWTIKAAVRRPVLLAGLLLFFLFSLYLPTRVLFVRVDGNVTVPARQILAAGEDCGIRFGASRREVRSEKVKNALLGVMPQLQWAGVNTSGCVATISVRERADTAQLEQEKGVSSLVASRDGIIVSCTVTDGSARCTVGQAVKEGQVLISGYTDCGIILQATRAEGEIMAQTRRSITAMTLPEKTIRGDQGSISKNYSLILGKKRINFANSSGICDTSCGRMYKEYYITLPGGFALPVALAVDTHTCYSVETCGKSGEECYQALISFCERYVRNQMVSGSIVDYELSAQTGNDSCRVDADYVCLEMIGRRRQEK